MVIHFNQFTKFLYLNKDISKADAITNVINLMSPFLILLVLGFIIRLVVSSLTRTSFMRYCFGNLQFLNNSIIVKTMVLLFKVLCALNFIFTFLLYVHIITSVLFLT